MCGGIAATVAAVGAVSVRRSAAMLPVKERRADEAQLHRRHDIAL